MNSRLRLFVFAVAIIFVCAAIWLTISPLNIERAAAQSSGQATADVSAAAREEAHRANNLGVALLEQFSYKQGAEQFRRALALDPALKIAQINLAIANFNLPDYETAQRDAEKAAQIAPDSPQPFYISGLIARTQNRADAAVAAFKKVLEFDAADVGANVNLGQILMQQRKYAEAVESFRVAVAAEPYNATAVYNLATALLRDNRRDEGQKLMTQFQTLRQSGAATTIGLNYLEQGRYAEAIAATGAESELVDKQTPKVVFQIEKIGLPVSPKSKESHAPRAATLFDFDNDGDLDLARIADTRPMLRLFRNDNGKFVDATARIGNLSAPFVSNAAGVVAGDYDNDGFADLLVFGTSQTALLRNAQNGVFVNATVAAKLPKPQLIFASGAFVDVDHDGDLDIFLGSKGYTNQATRAAPNQLWRNNGDSTFTDISEAAKIAVPSRAVAVVPTDYDNRRDVDLLVLNRGGNPILFRNLRDGSFRDVAAEVGLDQTGDWTSAAAGDFNKDGFTDFFFGKLAGVGVFAISDGHGKFKMQNAPANTENAAAAQFLDFDNDGLLDLIANTNKGFVVARNLGDSWTSADSSAFKIGANNAFANSRQMLSGDIDSDRDVDLLAFGANGDSQYLRNAGGSLNRSVTIALKGRVSNRTGVGAKVDLRAGSLAQKLETYAASPAPAPSEIHFGLGKRIKPDTVRVIWTSGIVQSETEISAAPQDNVGDARPPLRIEELDRKPSSCPYLYTWNGEKFEFITDFLGGGEMGNWKEAGIYHHPDSDEFVRITSEQLKPVNGRYEIRVTNELEEVLFLDKLKLLAVEHDADIEVYPNEGLGIPTAGKHILHRTNDERAPLSAVDSNGKNVLPQIEKLDRRFYDSFKSQKIRGYAETHNLTLNLGGKQSANGKTLLLLTGWTDYAFSSDNLAASQSGKSLFMPKLQVKNAKGEWQTVIESIGISVGRPQTLVVDLTGKFLTDSREVRIVTNFKTFWDKIAVGSGGESATQTTELQTARANLGERGFSEEIRFGEMIAANYSRVLNDSRWKQFAGAFTKTGDVAPLLNDVDDVFVISKTGDELVLSFQALPDLPADKKRTFLLFADGYSKEMDINSGSPDQVFPLPFKAMKKYPYAATDAQFPMTVEKQKIYDEYTTRFIKGVLPRVETSLLK